MYNIIKIVNSRSFSPVKQFVVVATRNDAVRLLFSEKVLLVGSLLFLFAHRFSLPPPSLARSRGSLCSLYLSRFSLRSQSFVRRSSRFVSRWSRIPRICEVASRSLAFDLSLSPVRRAHVTHKQMAFTHARSLPPVALSCRPYPRTHSHFVFTYLNVRWFFLFLLLFLCFFFINNTS